MKTPWGNQETITPNICLNKSGRSKDENRPVALFRLNKVGFSTISSWGQCKSTGEQHRAHGVNVNPLVSSIVPMGGGL